jgi:CheY-like chemotaxis protein
MPVCSTLACQPWTTTRWHVHCVQPQTASGLLIAITAYGQEHHRRNAMEAGFVHHFVKPVDTAEILVLLETINQQKL